MVKAAVERNEAAKEIYMEAYKEEKRNVNRYIYIYMSKKGGK